MKKLLFILLMATLSMSSTCTKEDDLSGSSSSTNLNTSQVPSGVMSAFNSRYPNASGQIEWEKEDGNTYKVKFFIGSQRWQALFTANAVFISEKAI